MVTRVTSEQRESLRQLDAVRREAQQFDQALSQTGNLTSTQNITDAFAGIELPAPPKSNVNDPKALTLQEKQKYVSVSLL